MFKKLVSLAVFLFVASGAFAQVYNVDLDHSTVSFKIRHLFSKVQGLFREFEGTIHYDPSDLKAFKAEGVVKASSIDTNVEKRDEHLRSDDFFDVENYPEITLKTKKVQSIDADTLTVLADLTLKGVTKEVVLDIEIHGVGEDPWGNTLLGLTAQTEINRKDFGLTWNKILETGNALVGEKVDITIEIEAILQE